jgi:hypothetical protein
MGHGEGLRLFRAHESLFLDEDPPTSLRLHERTTWPESLARRLPVRYPPPL